MSRDSNGYTHVQSVHRSAVDAEEAAKALTLPCDKCGADPQIDTDDISYQTFRLEKTRRKTTLAAPEPAPSGNKCHACEYVAKNLEALQKHIEKKHSELEDFVIVRSNGNPLYMLCNVVDDARDRSLGVAGRADLRHCGARSERRSGGGAAPVA